MRILQLTPRIAWPPTDGGRVVMLQVARALHRLGAEIEVLSLNPRKQHVDVEAARRALAPVPLDAVDIDTSAHAAALFRSFRTGTPQLVARFFSPRFEDALRKHLGARDFDVVQIESPFLLPYLPAIRESSRAVVVLRSLNVEFRIWERLAANEKNVLRRAALSTIARGLRRYEIARLDECDAIVPITDADAREFRELGCSRPMFVLPGGVEISPRSLDFARDDMSSVGFLGSLDYRPNQEAAVWIVEELRPRLPPQIDVHVAGSRAPEWLRERFAGSGVVFHGEVADAASFAGEMAVMIAPIFAGGGMRIKILEAMAAGKAVVATTIGAEGIDVTHGENILIADDSDAFAGAITSLIGDPSRARAIADAARTLVATRYSTDVLARGLLAFLTEVADELSKRRGIRGGD